MKQKILLGATKYNELVFGKIDFRDGEFFASFDTVSPVNKDNRDIYEEARDYLDYLPPDELWELACAYDVAPSCLYQYYADDHDLEDFIDCSVYPETIEVENNDWIFETSGCGQHDTTDEMVIFVNKDFYDLLMKTWKEYHRKELPEDIYQQLLDGIQLYTNFAEEDWIRTFIKEHF